VSTCECGQPAERVRWGRTYVEACATCQDLDAYEGGSGAFVVLQALRVGGAMSQEGIALECGLTDKNVRLNLRKLIDLGRVNSYKVGATQRKMYYLGDPRRSACLDFTPFKAAGCDAQVRWKVYATTGETRTFRDDEAGFHRMNTYIARLRDAKRYFGSIDTKYRPASIRRSPRRQPCGPASTG